MHLTGGLEEERSFLKVLLQRTYPTFARDLDAGILQLSARGSWNSAVADAGAGLTPMPPFAPAVSRSVGGRIRGASPRDAWDRDRKIMSRTERDSVASVDPLAGTQFLDADSSPEDFKSTGISWIASV